jgi:DNA (cytosine-5)-methyltransferase 1
VRLGSLCSGVGGLERGVEWATGATTAWQVEADAFCRGVLAMHWPKADRSVVDVFDAEGLARLPRVDAVCAGFPCQPSSAAGARLGRADERWIWPAIAAAIGVVRPRVVFLENVAGLLSVDGGGGFGDVLADLAALGFDAEWTMLRASDVGAPHRRERLFVLAHAHGSGLTGLRLGGLPSNGNAECGDDADRCGGAGHLGNAAVQGRARPDDGAERAGLGAALSAGEGVADSHIARREGPVPEQAQRRTRPADRRGSEGAGLAQPRLGGNAHGLPHRLDRWPARPGEAQHAWEPPRTAASVPNRPARLRALGNAVVSAQAEAAWLDLAARIAA